MAFRIIVAWIGRLDPIGVIFGSALMALLYLAARRRRWRWLTVRDHRFLPGLLLFCLLATDLFITFRLKQSAPFGASNRGLDRLESAA